MLSNTGTVALVLYLVLIGLAFIGTLWALKLSQKNKISDKMIDLFKWAIFTVGIGTTGFIVTDLFKEREQDLKELDYFDKYVQDVKKADGVEERLRLVKYLSIVSPSGEIKKAWQEYFHEVSREYEEYLELKAQESTDESIMNLPLEERVKAIDNQAKLNAFEKPLARGSEVESKPTLFIQYCDRRNQVAMMTIRSTFLDHAWNAPGIEFKERGCDNSIRYFHDEDRELADQANSLLGNKYIIKKVNLRAPKGQIELWAAD